MLSFSKICTISSTLLCALACGDLPSPTQSDEQGDVCEAQDQAYEDLTDYGTSQQALSTPELVFTRWYNHGDPGDLWEAMECAAERIRAATCLDIDLSVTGAAHWVRWAPLEDMPNSSMGYVTGSSWNVQKIRLLEGMPEIKWCPILIHEMIHVLRRSYSHPGVDGTMSYSIVHTSSQPLTMIRQQDLDLICAKQTCGCQNPEGP